VRIESRRKARHPGRLSDPERSDKRLRRKDLRSGVWPRSQAPARSDLPNCDFPVFFPASSDRAKRANQPRGWGAKPRAPRETGGQPSCRNFRQGPRSGQAQASPQGCRGRLSPPLRRAGAPTRASAPLPRVEPVPGLTRANAPWTMHQTENSTRAILEEPTSQRLGSRRAPPSGRRATFAASTPSSGAAARAGGEAGARSRGRGDGRVGREVEGPAFGRLWGQASGVVDGGDAPGTRLWGRPGSRARSAVARFARRLAATGTDAEICSRSGG
jgi:hypothetical protein